MNSFEFNRFRLLLSASIPKESRAEKYRKTPNAQLCIEEAVMCVARTVFARKGQLVFGGHPSISPFVSMIAGEYISNPTIPQAYDASPANIYKPQKNGHPPIVIYQSELFKNSLPEKTLFMLEQRRAFVRWTPIKKGEKYDFKNSDPDQCPASFNEMRSKMVSENEVDAMVCIGGMEGVEKEYQMFRNAYKNKPVYVLKTTGGAASIIGALNDSYLYVMDDGYGDGPANKYKALKIPYLSIATRLVNNILKSKY